MTSRVSVVVPTRNAAATLERCLVSIRAQHGEEAEIVVVDNGSDDETVAIATRHADLVLAGGPERSAQRNQGWRTARGDVVIFIDADMTLEPEVVAEAVATLDADLDLSALVIPEQAHGDGFFAHCRVLEKQLYLGEVQVEAARVFRRTVLEATGGFDVRLTAFEDWDLADRVGAAGFQTGRVSAQVWHDEGRIVLRRAFAKKRYYGRWLHIYRNRSDSPPARQLARPVVFRKWRALVRHPLLSGGLLILKTTEAAGFAVGAAKTRPGTSRHRS